jgi:hypothetical protein
MKVGTGRKERRRRAGERAKGKDRKPEKWTGRKEGRRRGGERSWGPERKGKKTGKKVMAWVI